jgi:hypothetical protein
MLFYFIFFISKKLYLLSNKRLSKNNKLKIPIFVKQKKSEKKKYIKENIFKIKKNLINNEKYIV